MATNTSSKPPAATLRCGNIKATIWQNVSEKGPFLSTTFSRPFKDSGGANPRSGHHKYEPGLHRKKGQASNLDKEQADDAGRRARS